MSVRAKDLNEMEARTLVAELLSAAVMLREEARTTPCDRGECLRIVQWMGARLDAAIEVPRLAQRATSETISAEGIAIHADGIAARLKPRWQEFADTDTVVDPAGLLQLFRETAVSVGQLAQRVRNSVHRAVA